MKILIIGGNLSIINGWTNAVLSISEAIGKTSPTSLLPVFPLLYDTRCQGDKRSFTILSKKKLLTTGNLIKNFSASFSSIKQYINPFTMNGFFYFFNDLCQRAIFEKILDDQKPDVVNIHGLILDNLSLIEICRKRNIPFCVTIHAVAFTDNNVELRYNKDFEKKEFEKLFENRVPIITVSSGIADILKSVFKMDYQPIVIQNGVDFTRFCRTDNEIEDVRKKFSLPSEKKIILQVGSLIKRKNQISVLQCLAEMDDAFRNKIHYLIVGEGPEKKSLQDFCKLHKLDTICTFTGQIPDNDLNTLYVLSDFFILPSTSEGLALVTLEALAAGLPVIAFEDLQGIREIFHPDCVQLIKDHTVVSMKDALEEAITKKWNKERIISYSKKWSWDAVGEKYTTLNQNLIHSKNDT